MRHFLLKISESSRSRDWRLSMLPFIMGCVYLWIWHFQLPFTGRTLLLVALSLTTSTGFAALGYFINEFFDQQQDALAGKINRVAPLSSVQRLVWVSVITSVAFLPWLWLPSNNWSRVLIVIQIGLFLIYSLPFPRLKAVPFISNLVDMGYAYLVPLVLSFHTFALFAGGAYPAWVFPLAGTVGLIGFRNIVIHQVNDVFNDKRAGIVTLPILLGPKRVTYLIYTLLSLETIAFVASGIMISTEGRHSYLFIIMSLALFCILSASNLSKNRLMMLSPLDNIRHLTDPFYQIYFPLLLLFLLSTDELRWITLLPLHATLFVPNSLMKDSWVGIKGLTPKLGALHWRAFVWARHKVSCAVNYPLYWLFRLVGVDLIKERKSALQYVVSRIF